MSLLTKDLICFTVRPERREVTLLKKIILVTQGQTPPWSRNVLKSARGAITELGKRIRENISDSTIKVLCADIKVPRVTAEIALREIGVTDVGYHRELNYFGSFDQGQWETIFGLVESAQNECECLLIFTLAEMANKFPHYWGKRYGFLIQESKNTPPATAVVIDVESGETFMLNGSDTTPRVL